eukprot:TRINITY_DN14770_c0_g1_i2.p1 TRINITY_DN14770_c0_g1~~TRINITY_DN14770_c0_g1_i2.p1  ORF type:complete len:812 (+),score=173.48 TRINITY_DN14770_c0_g1_i2:47-2482(+)
MTRTVCRILAFLLVTLSPLPCKGVSHMTEARCDALVEDWDYLDLDKGDANPYTMETARLRRETKMLASGVPFVKTHEVAYANDIIAYVDEIEGVDNATFVKVAILGDPHILFLPKNDFQRATTPSPAASFFSWSSVNQWKAYQRYSTDILTIPITYQSESARHVTTDGVTVAWVDFLNGFWDVIVYTKTLGTPAVFWRKQELPSKPDSVAHRLSPALCRGRLVFVEVSHTKTARVISYDIETGAEYRYEGVHMNMFHTEAWEMGNGDGCGFAWVETDSPVETIHSQGDLTALGYDPSSTPDMAYPFLLSTFLGKQAPPILVLETFPIHSTTYFPVEDGILTGLVGGGPHVFYTVAAPTGGTLLSSFTIDAKRVDLYISDDSIELHCGVTNGVIFKEGSSVLLHRMQVDEVLEAGLPVALHNYTCNMTTAYNMNRSALEAIDMMGGFLDQVVLHVKGSDTLERMDLDKDNDGLFDRQDRFPLFTEFAWDSDNDGEPDKADLITVYGSCTNDIFINPSSCLADTPIMWMIWGGITLVTFVITMAIGRARAYVMEQGHMSEAPSSSSEETDERIFQIVDENMGSNSKLYGELEEYMAIRDKVGTYRKVETAVQIFLLLLTVLSVMLVIIPLWETEHMSTRLIVIFTWIDVYTAMIFAIDLIFRWVYRDNPNLTFKAFFIENWFDFPSLLCDIPGLTNTSSLNVLVIARLLRTIRILKVFRVMRLYRKVTNQSAYLSLVLNHSNWLLPIIVVVLLVAVAIVLKVVEQDEQPVFGSYWNCLWFCFVTATTVGYGDMVPKHVLGRLLACLLMVSGIA